MKSKALSVIGSIFLFMLSACTGTSRPVESCDECQKNMNGRADEYCVQGEGTQLYCANPCVTHLDCTASQWCVPLPDQGTPWDDHVGRIRFVCMPDSFYYGKSKVRLVSDCQFCDQNETCLQDSNDNRTYCSEGCSSDSDCLSLCCAETQQGNHYCAPYNYCKSVDEIDDCSNCQGGTVCVKPEADSSNLMCTTKCSSSDECPFGHLCLPFNDASKSDGSYEWVCMPSKYYESKGKSRRMGGDCTTDTYKCGTNENCLYDDSQDPYIYFCSDECTNSADCVTGCCTNAGGQKDYCAPVDYCKK
ncbi:MAG: hypothetical protein GXP49_13065 [Deltaproteobacteria bacterium]|nr:hypothetical protein [Deltaproteobacteria bacterium]